MSRILTVFIIGGSLFLTGYLIKLNNGKKMEFKGFNCEKEGEKNVKTSDNV